MSVITGTSNDDILTGTAGDDTIDGAIGRDTVSGGAGNDSLTGGPGDDLVSGDDGADTVADGQGANTIHGGAGDDQISGVGLIYAEDGDDTVTGTASGLTVVGGLGNDSINATGELYGGAGADTITGNGVLGGEAGDDVLSGGQLAYLVGEDGNDRMYAQYGSTLVGGNGDDFIWNQDGATIDAGAGADILTLEGQFNPRLPGRPGAPVDVSLGDGDDTVYMLSYRGGIIRGGAGDDTIYQFENEFSFQPAPARLLTVVMDAGRDQLITTTVYAPDLVIQGFTAGAGGDVLRFASFTPPYGVPGDPPPSPPALTAEFTSDPFAANELRVIQSGADVLLQKHASGDITTWNTIATLQGVTRATLTAENFGGWNPLALPTVNLPIALQVQTNWDGNTNPFLTGHAALVQEGADTLLLMDRNGGANEMILLARYIETPASAITSALLSGVDPVVVPPGLATNDVINPVDTGYELHLFGGAGNDSIVGLGRADTIDGGSGADTLLAGGGDDSLSGGSGDDSLSGDAGSDTLAGGAGADTFRLSGDAAMDWVRDFNAAEGDRVYVTGPSWVAYQYGADVVVDAPGGRMMLQGVQLSSLPSGWIYGLDIPPTSQTGTAAAETMVGGSGADTLLGAGGDDSISSGGGADSLSGDSGNDTLAGGSGADTFRLTGQSDMDWVQDFNAAEGDRVMVAAGLTWTAYQYGEDTVVDVAGGRMMLQHTQLSSLPSGWIVSG